MIAFFQALHELDHEFVLLCLVEDEAGEVFHLCGLHQGCQRVDPQTPVVVCLRPQQHRLRVRVDDKGVIELGQSDDGAHLSFIFDSERAVQLSVNLHDLLAQKDCRLEIAVWLVEDFQLLRH